MANITIRFLTFIVILTKIGSISDIKDPKNKIFESPFWEKKIQNLFYVFLRQKTPLRGWGAMAALN